MVKVKNVYWMLAYAFDMLKDKGTQSMQTEDFDNIYNMLASILVKSLNYQIKKGLNKEYLQKTELLGAVKGKILISDSIKYNTLKEHKLLCEYDDFSINSYMNQIVKTTLFQLIKNSKVDETIRKEIKRILLCFKEVEEINLNNIKWNQLKYDRNNVTYKLTINVCYLILEGLIQRNENGERKLLDFIDEKKMGQLYEKFVKEYYRKHYPSLNARALHIDWDIIESDKGMLPEMKTDITLTYKEKTLIIDTKYYAYAMQNNAMYDKKTIRNNNLYQIFTYVKNKDKENTGNVSGMLLYAKTDEEKLPDQTNTFGKNVITVRTLDLTQDFEYVMEQLDGIVYEFSGGEVKKRL